MVRFDVVVANCNRIDLFWASIGNLAGLRPGQDRIIVMDCSIDPVAQLRTCEQSLTETWPAGPKPTLWFFERRNWNMNHGAQLDYIRLLANGKVDSPRYTFFLQDHYLNKNAHVLGDSIPPGSIIDLDAAETSLLRDPAQVLFCSRNGYRISASVPEPRQPRLCDNRIAYDGSKNLCFVVDGGNFIVRPEYFVNHYRKYPGMYTRGNGGYGFCHVWETRLSWILYDQGVSFHEISRKLSYARVGELKASYPKPTDVWHYFYHFPTDYFLYGRDLYRYRFKPRREYLHAIRAFIRNQLSYQRDASIYRLGSRDDGTCEREVAVYAKRRFSKRCT